METKLQSSLRAFTGSKITSGPLGHFLALPHVLQMSILVALVAALGELSLFLNGLSGNVTVLWFPNAFTLALLYLHSHLKMPRILAAHFVGILISNLFHGNSLIVSGGFGFANSLEVAIGFYLLNRVLGADWPHSNEQTFLRFIGLMAIPTSLMSALVGGSLLKAAYGMDFVSSFGAWVIGDAICLIAFTPLAIWLLNDTRERLFQSPTQAMLSSLGVLVIPVALLGSVYVGYETHGLLLLICFLVLLALNVGRGGAILMTAVLVPSICITGFVERDVLETQSALQLGSAIQAFAIVFLCAALPLNIIATMVERLRLAERTQQDISQMRTAMLASLSHEIKTPMNAIHGMFELFRMSDIEDRQMKWATAGLSASHSLQKQVNHLLEFSQQHETSVNVHREPVVLREELERWSIAAEAFILTSKKTIRIVAQVAPDTPKSVLLDRQRIQQIMMNLINNAVKFTEEGEITLSISPVGTTLSISVEDTGKGLSEADQLLVFDRYWQHSDNGNAQFGGSGLGLSICRELAEGMGAKLSVESKIGVGSRFMIILPIKANQENSSEVAL